MLYLIRTVITSVLLVMIFTRCASVEYDNNGPDLYSAFDFSDGMEGWVGGFSNYPAKLEDSLKLFSGYADFPYNLGLNKKTLVISGKNPHKNLFYFVKKRVESLRPETTYQVFLETQFIVESLEGDPGDGDIYVKYGAFNDNPEVKDLAIEHLPTDSVSVINVEIGKTPGDDGDYVRSVGALQLPRVGDNKIFKASNIDRPIVARTDKNGSLWLLVGFDSEVDAYLAFYFQTINIYYFKV